MRHCEQRLIASNMRERSAEGKTTQAATCAADCISRSQFAVYCIAETRITHFDFFLILLPGHETEDLRRALPMPAPIALQRALVCCFLRFESGLVLLPGLRKREDCRRKLVIEQNVIHHPKGGILLGTFDPTEILVIRIDRISVVEIDHRLGDRLDDAAALGV